jgi:hypothetical protein
VRHQVLDIFEQEGARLIFFDDAADVEEQRALRFVGKAVGTAEGVLFGDAGNREGLAREAGEQQVVGGDVLCVDFGDIAVDAVAAEVVFGIGLLRLAVPFAGEHTLPAEFLEGHADAANAGKQVDECEGGVVFKRQFQRQQALQAEDVFLRDFLIGDPVADGAWGDTKMSGDFALVVEAQGAFKITGGEVGIGSGVEYGGHGFPFLFWYRKRKLRRFLSQRKCWVIVRQSWTFARHWPCHFRFWPFPVVDRRKMLLVKAVEDMDGLVPGLC